MAMHPPGSVGLRAGCKQRQTCLGSHPSHERRLVQRPGGNGHNGRNERDGRNGRNGCNGRNGRSGRSGHSGRNGCDWRNGRNGDNSPPIVEMGDCGVSDENVRMSDSPRQRRVLSGPCTANGCLTVVLIKVCRGMRNSHFKASPPMLPSCLGTKPNSTDGPDRCWWTFLSRQITASRQTNPNHLNHALLAKAEIKYDIGTWLPRRQLKAGGIASARRKMHPSLLVGKGLR
ncbi:hypothetical protein K432DRAFT_448546 [Lepidopterella palustris CBS 459.81]|uniref:Uncharacterized protein n=1 Tax=Lepidopterella palustris CBS 459.81 TaxID=1314670 RepID=A0A8E2EDN8_9PEZI|nr:hypothetical protein K432DRAFT_448546 [Lepidopterella palustris CBS 459.81]